MLIRLWLFTSRVGPYPEGGTYDTSVLDTLSGDCYDPEQFDRFQNLLQYATSRGERLQKVTSAQEAYAMCSRARMAIVPTIAPNIAVSVGGTSSAFQGGTFEQGLYSPPTGNPNCPGGGVKIPPMAYNDPTLTVTTQSVNMQRVITNARGLPFGTVSY